MYNYRKINRKTVLKIISNKTPNFLKLPKLLINNNRTINLPKPKTRNKFIKTQQTKIIKNVWLGTMLKWGANNARLLFCTTPT